MLTSAFVKHNRISTARRCHSARKIDPLSAPKRAPPPTVDFVRSGNSFRRRPFRPCRGDRLPLRIARRWTARIVRSLIGLQRMPNAALCWTVPKWKAYRTRRSRAPLRTTPSTPIDSRRYRAAQLHPHSSSRRLPPQVAHGRLLVRRRHLVHESPKDLRPELYPPPPAN